MSPSTSTLEVRLAVPTDHDLVAELFLELATREPPPTLERFVDEMQSTTYVAELADAGGKRVVGYLFAQFLRTTVYVRHVASSPDVRRMGVGSALFARIKQEARARGCDRICLNVKPDNLPAIRLYEREGLSFRYLSSAHGFLFAAFPGHPVAGASVRELPPARDTEIEALFGLPDGQLSTARALPNRVILGVFCAAESQPEAETAQGVACFDTAFPGCFPFRVTSVELAPALLNGCHAVAKGPDMNLVIEDSPELEAWLRAAGIPPRLVFSHYAGAL